MIKILNKTTVTINIIGILIMLYIARTIAPHDSGFYSKTFFYSIFTIGTIYLVTFIHSFRYNKLKEKVTIVLVDLFPIVFYIFVVYNLEPNAELLQLFPFFAFFYLITAVVIILSNFVIHKLLVKVGAMKKKK